MDIKTGLLVVALLFAVIILFVGVKSSNFFGSLSGCVSDSDVMQCGTVMGVSVTMFVVAAASYLLVPKGFDIFKVTEQ